LRCFKEQSRWIKWVFFKEKPRDPARVALSEISIDPNAYAKRWLGPYAEHGWLKIKNPPIRRARDGTRCLLISMKRSRSLSDFRERRRRRCRNMMKSELLRAIQMEISRRDLSHYSDEGGLTVLGCPKCPGVGTLNTHGTTTSRGTPMAA
jgi:hypothetical protein